MEPRGVRRNLRPFRHARLPDPANYIRLLTFLPSDEPHEMLSFRMSTWPITKMPKYNAISYTWGGIDTTTILVNGRLLEIRKSCYDALVQALSHYGDTPVWIDSVCINQGSVHEKNHQVRRMYEVYRNSDRVLACVGDSEDSLWLSSVCRYAGKLGEDLSLGVWDSEDAEELLQRTCRRLGYPEREGFMERIWRSLRALGAHPYWTRLWVVQEIDAGGSRTEILCGLDSIKWHYLDATMIMLFKVEEGPLYDARGRVVPLDTVRWAVQGIYSKFRNSLSTLLEIVVGLKCQDPRDRLYGTIALVDWQAAGIPPILPDYSRTTWSLAGELLTGPIKQQDWQDLIEVLEINMDVPELRNLVQERTMPPSTTARNAQARKWNFKRTIVARLWGDANGTLQCALGGTHLMESDRSRLFAPLDLIGSPGYEWSNQHGAKPKKVFYGSQAVALLCGDTVPGDMLVIVGGAGLSEKCFVLRSGEGGVLDIVGNGILIDWKLTTKLPWKRFNEPKSLPGTEVFMADLLILGTWEDMILFATGVDEADIPKRDPHRELLHLMTRPVASPKGAARFVRIEHFLKEINRFAKMSWPSFTTRILQHGENSE